MEYIYGVYRVYDNTTGELLRESENVHTIANFMGFGVNMVNAIALQKSVYNNKCIRIENKEGTHYKKYALGKFFPIEED